MAAIPMLGGNGSSRPLLALPDQPATGGDYQKAALDAAGGMRESPIFSRKERHIGNGWPIVTSLIAFTRSPYDTLGTKSFVPASGLWGRFMTQPSPRPPWMSVPISASRFGRVRFSSQAPTAWQHIRVRPSDSCREDPISSGTGLASSLNWSDGASRFSISSHHRGKLESPV
jgi:hypothetical protein